MLTDLKIENVAVIEKAQIHFEKGLNILTGETGAGKSIVIDSINAVLGERASRDLVRDGADRARVTAEFTDVTDAVKAKLEDFGVECDDGTVIINRVITADGRSSCKINGESATASMLRQIGADLITICGQHDSQYLLQKERHMSFIDELANCGDLLESYRETLTEIKAVRKELRRLLNANDDKESRMEFLRFQINEITSANISLGEKQKLTDEKKLIQNKERLTKLLSACGCLIGGDEEGEGVSAKLFTLIESLKELSAFDLRFSQYISDLNELKYLLEDLNSTISGSLDDFDNDSVDINALEERLDTLYRIFRKYGEDEEAVLSYLDKITAEYESISMSDEIIEELQEKYSLLEDELLKRGCFLSDARKMAAVEFERRVTEELIYLDMPWARLVVNFNESPATEMGIDDIEFLFTANEGQEPKPLSKIASGGELSRVMLAIRCVLSDRDEISSMIFDEIDTGVSGRAAHKIARKLSELSRYKQVLCVTHLAQIASIADNHLYIEKSSSEGTTFTKVTSLSDEERVYEIARIMGGEAITQITLDSARELIGFFNKK